MNGYSFKNLYFVSRKLSSLKKRKKLSDNGKQAITFRVRNASGMADYPSSLPVLLRRFHDDPATDYLSVFLLSVSTRLRISASSAPGVSMLRKVTCNGSCMIMTHPCNIFQLKKISLRSFHIKDFRYDHR
ncbi:MAG: hypothetical protein BM485_10430 [Desulfobulbaceae bacterium DB1]|nr:MAG: hypothetical protein BM485_10430 [Desulfobulbaceae bacterium DB1]